MTGPILSVVMPTYNRCQILPKALDALFRQSEPTDAIEIVVVDDGSQDETPRTLEEARKRSPVPFSCFRQENKGPATARNRGIRQAEGKLVLLIGDDILAAPDLLEQHIQWHSRHPEPGVAVLGYTTWTPEIRITPFMRWLEDGGPQYKYWAIEDKLDAGYGHFYTSNISLRRSFLVENGLFDEDFPYASYEDTELGYRLTPKGLRIVYNDKAIGYHHHFTPLRNALKRMENVGESRCIFLGKTGQPIPSYNHRPWLLGTASSFKYALARQLGYLLEDKAVVPWLYSYLMGKALHLGMARYVSRM